jgi:hypothetical protein
MTAASKLFQVFDIDVKTKVGAILAPAISTGVEVTPALALKTAAFRPACEATLSKACVIGIDMINDLYFIFRIFCVSA